MYKIKLSPYAKIFYTEWLLDQDSYRYNISIDQVFYGNLNVKRLRASLKKYVAEHVLLNSHIQDINGEAYWVKNNSICELDYSNNFDSDAELLNYVVHSFDLHNGPLYRFKLVRIKAGVYKLIIVFHHLVLDGTSANNGLVGTLSNYYNDNDYSIKYSIGEQITLIASLADTLSIKLEQNQIKYKKFWQDSLIDIESLDLKFLKLDDGNNEIVLTKQYNSIKEIRFSYGEAELAKLNKIKREYVITPYSYGMCILALLLYKYTGQEYFAISYPIAIKEGADFIYGAQLNTNVIPYHVNANTAAIDILTQTREFFKLLKQDRVNCGYYPISDIINISNKHLLDVSFAQTNLGDTTFEFKDIKTVVSTQLHVDSTPNDALVFEQELKNNELNYRIRYDKKSINEELINNFVTIYKRLFVEVLEDIHTNNNRPISNYSLLTQKQYNQIVNEWNQAQREYPKNKTIHALFEEQSLKTPNNIAVVYKNIKLTYKELNDRSSQLANYLIRNYSIKADDLIALFLDRSEHMLIAILAVLKSGGAYVPINPDHPKNRVDDILQDTKTKIVLTDNINSINLENVKNSDVLIINNTLFQSELSRQPIQTPQVNITSNNLAYVIYTSGTTGKQNGVMIEHKSVVNYIYSISPRYTDIKRIDFSSNLAFDLTVTTTLFPLLTGKTIFVYSGTLHEIYAYTEHINTNYIELIKATPSFLLSMPDEAIDKQIKISIVGGEKLTPKAATHILKFTEQIIDEYGPTEATVGTTEYLITNKTRAYTIGKPYANCHIYVLDCNLNLLPVGAIGELHIGGDGLARGYLNRLDLTKKRFIPNPFQAEKEKLENRNNKLYKTGDLARILPNGNLEYIGRNDFQVKIDGYRIELGEIENKLIEYDGIKQAIVLVLEHISKCLVAYYVSDKKLDETKIQHYLESQLPKYMLPKVFIYLNKLPLTINGKLDRKVLLKYKIENDNKYEAPSNEQEQLICEAFTKILGVERVGVNDNFFELGGRSIQAIQLVAILQANFDIKITNVFDLPTPKQLAKNPYLSKNILKQKLMHIKSSRQNKQNKNNAINEHLQNKVNNYLKNIDNLQIDYSLKKPIVNILLTGATGYLGCNILNQLLKFTNYNVFALVRANSQEEAVDRINKKFQFYFDKTLSSPHDSRVFIIKSDIEKSDFELSQKEYYSLADKIDSVIHSAALVKHYGESEKFYLANVKSTINLLEFSKLTKLKDFHYISTYSVLNCGFIPNCEKYTCTEDDSPDLLEQWDNVYIRTKSQGEQEVVRYKKYGVNGNIYRVGNLAFMEENYRTQENIEDNAFFNWLKCLFKMNYVINDLDAVEISQVDFTAEAIIRLFDKKQLSNSIYHVFNPNLFNITNFLLDNKMRPVKTLKPEQFIDTIISNLSNNVYHDLIVKFLLHQGWLDSQTIKKTTLITILQNKTQHILKQLGFEWQPITKEAIKEYFKLMDK